MKVIISSGYRNFHMTSAAAEAAARGSLASLICGPYPKGFMYGLARLAKSLGARKAGKFAGRRVAVPDGLVHPLVICELLSLVSELIERRGLLGLGEFILRLSLGLYDQASCRSIKRLPSVDVFHFRAGFGGRSVRVARSLGMTTLCDLSIVHPAMLDFMVRNKGALPEQIPPGKLSLIWRHVLRDMAEADHILVNSTIVAKTCLRAGLPQSKVSTIYLGVDDEFLKMVPAHRIYRDTEKYFLFAGFFGHRKGADTLLDALQKLPSTGWQLRIAGVVSRELNGRLAQAATALPIHYLGNLSRDELAGEMSKADVFVFPTLAEGSARVVFEALASGCVVVTTENAGSVVKDGKQGDLVTPGDAAALAGALEKLIAQGSVEVQGKANAALVRAQYRQVDYGRNLDELYRLLSTSAGRAEHTRPAQPPA